MTFDPTSVEFYVWLYPRIIVSKSPENTSKYVDTVTFFAKKTWTKGHWPLDDLWPHICWGNMCDSTQGSLCPSPMKIHQSMWIQWTFLLKLEPKVIDPYMTFDPTSVEVTCVTLPKDHCVQVPWEYINVCGYSDQFCKNYHIHTHTTYSIGDHIVSFWTTFRRDKNVEGGQILPPPPALLGLKISHLGSFGAFCKTCHRSTCKFALQITLENFNSLRITEWNTNSKCLMIFIWSQ